MFIFGGVEKKSSFFSVLSKTAGVAQRGESEMKRGQDRIVLQFGASSECIPKYSRCEMKSSPENVEEIKTFKST